VLQQTAGPTRGAAPKPADAGSAPPVAKTNVGALNFVALKAKTFFSAAFLQVWSQKHFSEASDL
jgi:hypothetical protein